MSIKTELPEELLRGRAGFSKESLYTNKLVSSGTSEPYSIRKKRLDARRCIEDIQAARELEREINSF